MNLVKNHVIKFVISGLILSFSSFALAQNDDVLQNRIENKIITPRPVGEAYIRYRPNPKDKANKFYVGKKIVELAIPVTNEKVMVDKERIFNVSSKEINALLVVLDGNNGQKTKKTPVINHIKCSIPFKNIKKKGMQFRSRLRKDKKMLIIVVHDDIVGKKEITNYCYLKYIKDKVDQYRDYKDVSQNWELNLYKFSCGDETLDLREDKRLKPREDDGDVIGGNE